MTAPGAKAFRFESFTLDPARSCLSKDGIEIALRPKTFDVLWLLVDNAGRLLSKDEILRAAWPNVTVTEDSLVRCVHEARQALGDTAQRLIRTVPRRGYLFDAPVSSWEQGAVGVPLPGASSARATGAGRVAWPWPMMAGAVLLIAAALVGGWVWFRTSDGAMPDHPSIAVLPFVNLSGDPQHDFFSEGISEDLITALSGFPELLVIARNSSFAYKGRSVRAHQIGRELGVRYLLEGSVRREGSQLRISAQLVDTGTEKQLWARRYDRALADTFSVQDEITQEIVATLASSIMRADAARMLPVAAPDLSAYDLVLRAREVSFRTATESSTIEARELARRAIMIDPAYAPAHVELGRTYYRAFALEWAGPEALELASDAAKRAISLDQSSASAYELLGRIHLRRRHHGEAIATLERAISLNANRADSYASLADALTFAGRAEEAIPLLEKAIRLDPLYPPRIDMYLGRAYYFARRYTEAAPALETCIARAAGFRPCYMYLAPVYAELDRAEDARRTVAKLLEIAPDFTVNNSARRHLPFVDEPMRHYSAGLLKAGVPED